MVTKTRSLRQEQAQLAASLRQSGRTWVELAQVFAQRYRLNMRAALRVAHGWSQSEAAGRWNARWPAEMKTFKNFSYWELWPGPSGHAPSLDVLIRLAELYECAVSDLLADGPDFRTSDAAYRARSELAHLPAVLSELVVGDEHGVESIDPVDRAVSRGNLDAADVHAHDGASNSLAGFVDRLAEMDVEELASVVASWASQVHPEMSRRALLLKLSVGLTLAAAHPDLAIDSRQPDDLARPASASGDLSGVWHSRYLFYSTGRGGEYEGEHYMVFRQQGDRLAGQSLPHSMESRLRMHLLVDGSIATGTWSERTSPTGYYQGAVFHGTIQLIVNPMGRSMSGKWVGFGKNFQVNTGEWELTWVDGSTSPRSTRQYHQKA